MRPYDAFLLISFGGPEGNEDVIPFLENVTRGRGIPRERLAEVGEHYFLFGGVSPINQQCRDLIEAVRADFSANGAHLPIYWGNRFWDPLLTDTVAEMAKDGVRNVVALATSAYSCYSSHGAYIVDIEAAREAAGPDAPRIDLIPPFFDHPGFVEPLADHTRQALEHLPTSERAGARLLFSAHSIPTGMADASGTPEQEYGPGGAYVAQLAEVARLVSERLGTGNDYEVVYQSRSGPPSQPWLEPDINDRLAQLADEGVSAVVAVPHGFVSDHMEVMYDLDHEAADTARGLGMHFSRAHAPGTHPRFVSMVRELVAERADPEVGRTRLSELPTCPADGADCCRARPVGS
ncbi:ferrochelatase [Lipingzhangella halophila]|uniref:Coproporphyrin III ferrochelatase n=1 Tax=Lipingzhangella halophila TaxID=1783352 RepID=A0A7W7RHS0_9ACTN|nr:ferrochelatase [Lipingzhangella halophila]MBB4932208.1 ferrochelatase [Lipingzhangella halophila]